MHLKRVGFDRRQRADLDSASRLDDTLLEIAQHALND